jgi:hypothetical protein
MNVENLDMSEEDKRVTLTTNQILYLAGVVDRELERLRRIVDEHPSEQSMNIKRRREIEKLDSLTKALMASIG